MSSATAPANRLDVAAVTAGVTKRFDRTLHTDLVGATVSWPWRMPLAPPASKALAESFADTAARIRTLRAYAAAEGLELVDANRVVHGTTQPVPTHIVIDSIDTAARVAGPAATLQLDVGRRRLADLDARYGPIGAATLRTVGRWSDVDYELLVGVCDWFLVNDATGLTPRQVPVPGVHAKWLNTYQRVVETLVGRPLGLARPHPQRLHYTYLDPDHLAAGGRRHDSVSIGDAGAAPVYRPDVVIITENKDTAINFPPTPGGVAVEGNGKGGSAPAQVDWIRDAPTLIYWGDIDADGYVILNGYRAAGVPVSSILMDADTLDTYAEWASLHDRVGAVLTTAVRHDLPYLTTAERVAYERVTDPDEEVRRIEQERIPLHIAAARLETLRSAGTSTPTRN